MIDVALTQLRLGHEVDVWLDEAGRFTLTDPGRCSSDNGFGTGDVHDFEEEPCTNDKLVSFSVEWLDGTYNLPMTHCIAPR